MLGTVLPGDRVHGLISQMRPNKKVFGREKEKSVREGSREAVENLENSKVNIERSNI